MKPSFDETQTDYRLCQKLLSSDTYC